MELKRTHSPPPPTGSPNPYEYYYQAAAKRAYYQPPPLYSPFSSPPTAGLTSYGQPTNLSLHHSTPPPERSHYPEFQSQPTNLSLSYSQQQSSSTGTFQQSSPSFQQQSGFHHQQQFQDTPSQLLSIELDLVNKLKPIPIPPPVSYIYSPLEYAYEPHADYVRKYCKGKKRVLFLGMNPGPWGMSQTGVPFGEVSLTSQWLKIEGRIGKPLLEHPSRIIEGFACPRSEVSGQRFWSYWKDLCREPEVLFKYSYVHNYCPLAFMKDSGRNVTPPELKARERNLIFQSCDEALLRVIRLLEPETVIGVGKFPQQRAAGVVQVVKLKPTPAAGVTARDELHRELMFNQRIGKDVLQQKPELKRVLESRKYRKPPEENRTESELQRVHSRIISQQQERGEEQNNN